MNSRTKTIIMHITKSFPIALFILGLTNCGSSGRTIEVQRTGGYQQSHGPFDSNGNYVESWADKSPKRKFVWGRSTSKKPKSNTSSSTGSSSRKNTSTARKSTPSPTSVPKKTYTPSRSKSTYKPARKSTARKITPKTKPPISHTVRKGDTLYGLSRKYGASVSSIQKANGLKGNSISIGKRLIIPRK